MADITRPIGVFDSGVGGLSVLRHIRAQLPDEDLLYFADSSHAPYGDKSEQVLASRSLAIAAFLVEHGAKAIVVACNTATVHAVKLLRAQYPDVPIVGVEPGLKPAAAITRNGKVGVMATDATLAGEKFQSLLERVSESSQAAFFLQGCTGLANQIESGEFDSPATRAMLERYVTPLLDQGADTLVLGCTHYPFVRSTIESIIAQSGKADVQLVDTGDAVARHLSNLLETAQLRRHGHVNARLHGFTTGSAEALQLAFMSLLRLSVPVTHVDLDA